jgi:hypothetical protein
MAGFLDNQSAANITEAIYDGYFGRAADGPGYLYWVQTYTSEISSGLSSVVAATNIANSFAQQNEAKAIYSFLSSPPPVLNGSDPVQVAAVDSLIETVYQNLFSRAADGTGGIGSAATGGLGYWQNQILTGSVSVGAAIYDIADGAQGTDQTILAEKITAAEDFTQVTYANPNAVPAANFLAAARSSVSSVNSPATLAASEAATQALITPPTTTAVLPNSVVNVTASTIIGSLTLFTTDGHGPTLLPGDVLNGTPGATNNALIVTDLSAGVANDIIPSGVTINNVQNVTLNSSGDTAAQGFNSTPYTSVNNLTVTTAGNGLDVVQAGNGTNGTTATTVTVSHTSNVGGGLIELGGAAVTINASGTGGGAGFKADNPTTGAVLVGLTAAGTVPPPSNVASGAISVTSSNTGPGNIDVVGGTSVTVSAQSASFGGVINVGNDFTNTGNSPFGGLANTAGAITITSAGPGAITAFGGAAVNVGSGGGIVTVGDLSGTLASNEATGLITVKDSAPAAFDGLNPNGFSYFNNVLPGNVLVPNSAIGGTHNFTNNPVSVYGGSGVTVTTNAGSVAVGTPTAVAGTDTTGNVTVTDTANDQTDGIAGNAAVFVYGGAVDQVTANDDSVTVGSPTTAAADATGAVTVMETAASTMQDVSGQFADLFGGPPPLSLFQNNPHVITIDGGVGVNVTALGQNVVVGANLGTAGAQVVTQTAVLTGAGMAQGAGAVTVDGGTTVLVTTTGGNVTVGSVNFQPSAGVTIQDNFGSGNATADAVTVMGGTTVGVTIASADTQPISIGSVGAGVLAGGVVLNAAKTAVANTSLDPTGNVTIADDQVNATTAYGTGNVNVTTNGSGSVTIAGGLIGQIVDAESTTGSLNAAVGTSKLATVSLTGAQTGTAALIQTDALSSLSVLSSAAATYTLQDNTPAYALAITLGGDAKAITIRDVPTTGTGAGAITVSDNGSASAGLVTLSAPSATTLTLKTSAAASFNLAADTALTTVTASNTGTGTLNLGNLAGSAKLANINAQAATGPISVQINDANTSFNGTGSTGAETVGISSNTLGTGVAISAGSPTTGSNTLVINYNAATADVPISGKVSGFTALTLGNVHSDLTGLVYQPTVAAQAQVDTITVNAAVAGDNYVIDIGGVQVASESFKAGDTDQSIAQRLAGDVFGNATGVSVSQPVNGAFMITATKAGTGFTVTTPGTTAGAMSDATTTPNVVPQTGSPAYDASGFKALTVGATNGDVSFINAAAGATLTVGAPAPSVAGGAPLAALFPTGIVNYLLAKTTSTSALPLQIGVDGPADVLGLTGTVTTPGTGTTGNTGLAPVEVATTGIPQANISSEGVVKDPKGVAQTNFLVLGDTALTGVAITGDQALTVATVSDSLQPLTGATSLLTTIDASKATGAVTLTAVAADPLMTGVVLQESATGVVHTISGGTGALTAAGGTSVLDTDTFNVGSGGGSITLGKGGDWSALKVGFGYSGGSEAINLTAVSSTSPVVKATTVVVNDGVVSTQATVGGTNIGGVSTFNEAVTNPDVLSYAQPKGLLPNVLTETTLSNLPDFAALIAALGVGAGTTSLANLNALHFTVVDGVIQFDTSAGGTLLSSIPAQDLVSASEIIVNNYGAGLVGAFNTSTNTFVVSDDAAQTLLNHGPAQNADSVVELVADGTPAGFGPTGAANSIDVKGVTFIDATPADTNQSNASYFTATQSYGVGGFSSTTIGAVAALTAQAAANKIPVFASAASEHGTDSYTLNGLAAAGVVNIDAGVGAAGPHVGDLVVNQVGTSGSESLTVNVGNSGDTTTIDSLTFNGDAALTLDAANGFATGVVSALTDSSNSLATLTIGGNAAFTVDSVSSTSLATISITDTNSVTLFDTAAYSGAVTLTDNGAAGVAAGALTIGAGTTFGLTGSGDTLTIGSASLNDNANSTLAVSGAHETITIDGIGNNTIFATGSNDTITVGDTANGIGSDTIHATGASETVTLLGASGGPIVNVTVGNGATVNLSSTAAHPTNENVIVTGDTAGGTSASFLQTTLNHAVDNAGQSLTFGNSASNGGALNEVLAGAFVATSMVNVASVSSLPTAQQLPAALDLAASQAAFAINPNPNLTSFDKIPAQTGVIDWFQLAGNTYIVEAVNGANTPAAHTALGAQDSVVELTGLVNIGLHGALGGGGHVLTL